jgi:hypothetical protein
MGAPGICRGGKILAHPRSSSGPQAPHFQWIAVGQERANWVAMNVNALSSIANPFIQSLTSAALSALNATAGKTNTSGVSSTANSQDGSAQLSPFAQLMSTLQQLQQSSPSQYQSLTKQIAANLQSASQTAQAQGNTAQAQQLNTLATDFQNASTNNQLPNVADLAQAMSGHHHQFSQSSSQSSSSGTSTDNSSSQNQSVSQLLAAYSANSNASDALNPMNIIVSTMSSAGITMGN